MLHNQQGYMMYPMMDQNYQQWNQSPSYDSARGKSHGHSKSSSADKDPKKSPKSMKKNGQNMYPQHAVNQFVPVYMLPPGFAGHPGAFNAALAAHAAQNANSNNNNGGQNNGHNNGPVHYQLPTYGHYPYGIQMPYGFPNMAAAAAHQKGHYYNPSGYSGSDYNSASHSAHSHSDSSHRGSKSSDSMGKSRNSRSLTSKDSATHSTGIHSNGSGNKKQNNSGTKNHKTKNGKKFQSTHQITIQKGAKHRPVKLQNSCGRSHSVGSDLSAGCSASACQPTTTTRGSSARSCSHDSHPDSGNGRISNEKRKVSGCCSAECDHHGLIFQNMRKFSNNQDFKKPNGDLTKKLIELIEFYLSDDYLAKDKYLLRQIRCKSEGYISIKLMTSFKKVKKLTRDWRSVRFALLQSPNLIVSPEGFRVKRATQLPENLRKPRLLSSVVTIRLTESLSSVDALTGKFSKYGEIGLVRILKPGKEIPSDLRNYATQVPDIGKSMCAVVDFEQSESALQAVRCLKDELMNDKMRLALLGPRVRRTLYKQDRGDDDEDNEDEDEDNNVVQKLPLKEEKTIENEPEAEEESSYKNMVIKNKTTRADSNDSNTTCTTHKSSEMSVDSGNCGASAISGNNISTDYDLSASAKNITLDDSSNKANGKNIIRQPEGPGANPVMSGFAYKRSALF